MTALVRLPVAWDRKLYFEEFEACKLAFDEAYPGERASKPDHLSHCSHWGEFRTAWLRSHPFLLENQ